MTYSIVSDTGGAGMEMENSYLFQAQMQCYSTMLQQYGCSSYALLGEFIPLCTALVEADGSSIKSLKENIT